MRDMIAEHQGLAGVYAISTGTLAIGQALAATGRQEATTMIAHELTAHRRQMLLDGIIDAVIDQNPELEVLTALEVLAHHFGATGETPDPNSSRRSRFTSEKIARLLVQRKTMPFVKPNACIWTVCRPDR